ncbi:MAG TPA: hypothetical protein VIH88_00340 [Candidatus Acidoferrales bacterium]
MAKALKQSALVCMPSRAYSGFQRLPFVLLILAWAICSLPSADAQTVRGLEAPTTFEKPHAITVKGCLADTGSLGFFLLSDTDELPRPSYHIVGPASVLRRYTKEWDTVQVVGVMAASGDSATIRAKSIRVIHRQISRSPELGSSAGWYTYSDADYGVSIKYPASFRPPADLPDQQQSPNFVNPGAAQTLLTLTMAREIYPNTAFAAGSVSVSVSDATPNAATCSIFGQTWVGSPGPRTVQGIAYSEGIIPSVAGGTSYPGYFFHTFQNGLCYEIDVELAVGNAKNFDLGCDLDLVDEEALMNPILSGLSFSKPAVEVKLSANSASSPAIASFEATPAPSRFIPETKISWSVSGADYVRVAFKCDPNIGTAQREVECGPVAYVSYAYADEDSVVAGFQNRNQGPASVLVTLQPFLNGVGDPAWSKTISVAVPPIN